MCLKDAIILNFTNKIPTKKNKRKYKRKFCKLLKSKLYLREFRQKVAFFAVIIDFWF